MFAVNKFLDKNRAESRSQRRARSQGFRHGSLGVEDRRVKDGHGDFLGMSQPADFCAAENDPSTLFGERTVNDRVILVARRVLDIARHQLFANKAVDRTMYPP